jgi:hypothetical protein
MILSEVDAVTTESSNLGIHFLANESRVVDNCETLATNVVTSGDRGIRVVQQL